MAGTSRKVAKVFKSVWQSEGRGAMVRRSIGRPDVLRSLDPFLMLDEFQGDAREGAGFPDHPHRGFETVSYLLEGQFIHEDFTGRRGVLEPGDLQWMTAGRGVVHSEMPGPCKTRGLQLWVNLRKELKMIPPEYQELKAASIPQSTSPTSRGVTVKVIAGESMGIKSPVMTKTPVYFLDFVLDPSEAASTEFSQDLPEGWAAFVYVLDGAVNFGPLEGPHIKVEGGHTGVLSHEGRHIDFRNESGSKAHFVLVAGEPIGEPVCQRGPFVMNTQEELAQAFSDYRSCKNGFEPAKHWKSVEGNKD